MLQLTNTHTEEILTRGYTVIEDVVSSRQILEAKEALTKIYAREKKLSPLLNTESYQRSICLVHKNKVFRSICQSSELLELLRSLLGNDCTLGSLNALSTKPHDEQQHLHFDQRGGSGALSMLIAVFPLDHSTLKTGCLRLVPASHKMMHSNGAKADSTLAQFAHLESQAIHVEARAGSLIVLNGLLLHALSRNESEESSSAVIATYCRKWIKPLFNFVKSTPEPIASTFTTAEKQLLGYHDPHPVVYDYKRCDVYEPSQFRLNIARIRRKIEKLTYSLFPDQG